MMRVRLTILAAMAFVVAGCATAPTGPIPRVIDVTNTHRTAG